MSPPEVWGPPIWTLFHTLIEKTNEKYYHLIYQQLFNIIKQICNYLPCPECSNDATVFLSKIKIQNLNTKSNFKNMMYLFHNYVNKKKHKPLFNFSNISVYKSKNLLYVIQNFIKVYNTKGNMKLLTQSFQRQMVINNFRKWIMNNIFFFQETPQPNTTNIINENIENAKTKEDTNISFSTNNVADKEETNTEPVLEQNETIVYDDKPKTNTDTVLEQNETIIYNDDAEKTLEPVLENNESTSLDDEEKTLEPVLENNEFTSFNNVSERTIDVVLENNESTSFNNVSERTIDVVLENNESTSLNDHEEKTLDVVLENNDNVL